MTGQSLFKGILPRLIKNIQPNSFFFLHY